MKNLNGPILILGAGGFIGGHLFRQLRAVRTDVYGTFSPTAKTGLLSEARFHADLETHARAIVEIVKPATIFDCVAYGGYLAQKDVSRIYRTNVVLKAQLLELAAEYGITYVHAGSSSEYGRIMDAPTEDSALLPNSHYAVAKGAGAGLVWYFGKHRGVRCANLRLYAVYGPGEREEDRLIPQLVKAARQGNYPPLGAATITRDFIHVDDVCDAFVAAALSLEHNHHAVRGVVPGDSFNIGTGIPTSLKELAYLAKGIFGLQGNPTFLNAPMREYDLPGSWYARPFKAQSCLGWRAKISLREGLERLRW